MAENLLEVRNLVVNVEDKEILHNINLDIKPGETHVLMGPNGAGKSTLVPGISLSSFLKTALEQQRGIRIKAWDFRKELRQAMALLQMDSKYAERDLNTGFSGGEKKKAEILQLLMLNPKLAILDETDSGLDVDAVKIVSQGIKTFQEHRQGALLIILDALHVDHTHILAQGQIIKNAGPELVDEVSKNGFEKFLQNKE